MTETALATATYAPSEATRKHAHVDAATYDKMYAASINDPDGFWSEQAQRVDWIKPFTKVKDVNFDLGNVLKALGRLDAAAARHREAIRLRPDMAEAHTDLGQMASR